jgi:hypothetical protein
MEIKKVYATSNGGLFWSKDEAEEPKNHGKNLPVREVYVLIADVEVDAGVRGFGNVTMAFELNPVEIR